MKKHLLKSLFLLCALVVGSSAWADNASITTFSTTSGSIDSHISYAAYQGDGTTAPAINSNWLRIYKPASEKTTGGYVTITAASGYKMSSVTITNANDKNGTIRYSVDGGDLSSNVSLTKDNSHTVNSLNASSISFYNCGSDRLSIAGFSITYSSTGGGSTPSISLSTNSISPTSVAGDGTITVTYNNIASIDAEVNYYESDGTTPATYSWIDADINGDNNIYYTYDANTGAERTAYMKVHEKNEDVYSELITVTQAAYSVATPTPNLEGGSYLEGTALTFTSAGNTIYYTTDGSVPTNASTEYTGPIAISSGKITYKAIAYDANNIASNVVTRTITGVAPTSLPFGWGGGTTDDFEALTGVVGFSLGDYAAGNAPYLIQLNATGDYIEIFTNEKPVKVTMNVKMIGGGNTSKIKVQESTNGAIFSDVEELTISGSSGSKRTLETSESFAATTRVIKLYFTKGSNVGVGAISVFGEPTAEINSTYKWATFSYPKALDFTSTDVEAYIITGTNGASLIKERVYKVPANTGLLVTGTTDDIPVTADATDDVSSNLLLPGTGAEIVPGSGTTYVLTTDGGTNAIFKTVGAKHPIVPVGKAYLVIPSAGAHDFFYIDNETTSVNEVKAQKSNYLYYDLQGRKVVNPTKGLYIINGKKAIIK